MYKIMGKYKGHKAEVLDETDSQHDAEYLKQEYRLAYGLEWLIWIKHNDRSKI